MKILNISLIEMDTKNIILKSEYINIHGEKMIIILDDKFQVWVHHNDCNNQFELFSFFSIKYTLTESEKLILDNFKIITKSICSEHEDFKNITSI